MGAPRILGAVMVAISLVLLWMGWV